MSAYSQKRTLEPVPTLLGGFAPLAPQEVKRLSYKKQILASLKRPGYTEPVVVDLVVGEVPEAVAAAAD